MDKQTDTAPVGHYTINGNSQRLSIDRGTLRKIITDHGITSSMKIGRNNYYKLADIVDVMVHGCAKLDLTQERAKLTKRQEEKTCIQIEQLKGDLIPAEDVEKGWVSLVSDMRAKLLTIPTKAAPLVIVCDDAAEAKAILKEQVSDALTELHTELSSIFT